MATIVLLLLLFISVTFPRSKLSFTSPSETSENIPKDLRMLGVEVGSVDYYNVDYVRRGMIIEKLGRKKQAAKARET